MAPKVIYQFIGETLPFNRVKTEQLCDFVDALQVEYFPKGSMIFKQDGQPVDHLHIIQRGAVKVFVRTDEDHITIRDLGGEGAIFGAEWILGNSPPDVYVEAVEDTFCLLAHKQAFLDFLEKHQGLRKHFLHDLTEDKMTEAYAKLRSDRITVSESRRFDYFSTKVAQIIRKALVTVNRSLSVLEVGQLMAGQGLGSVLVKDDLGEIVGIVTKKDLRARVVACRMDYNSPIDQIMSSPVKIIPAQAVCFEAMVKMIREQITHLAVQHGSEIVGIVSAHDIMVNQVAAPVVLLRDITTQNKTDDLSLFHQRLPSIVRRLLEQGARASHIQTLVALMNDRFMLKLINLVQQKIGKSPVNFTRLLFGESGRREMSLFPSYDNGIVYEDPSENLSDSNDLTYLEAFARSVADAFQSCCAGPSRPRICASNPRWRQPLSFWKQYLRESVLNPIPPDLPITKQILDFRPLYGRLRLGDDLRISISGEITHATSFRKMLARDFLKHTAPVSFFRDSAVESDGSSAPSIDLQTRLIDPYVNFARLMAISYGINQTNTLDRLQELSERGIFSFSTIHDISAAYEFNVQLGIMNQLKQFEAGAMPDSFVAVSDLSNLERLMLKDTFSVMNKIVDVVKNRFID